MDPRTVKQGSCVIPKVDTDATLERSGLVQMAIFRPRFDPVVHRTRIAVSVLFAVMLAGCVTNTGAVPIQPGESGPTSTAVTSSRPVAAATDAAMLLTLAPVPPGAQGEASSPVQATFGAPQTPGSPDLVDQAAWWTAPGTMAAVTAWVGAHAPVGATVMGRGSSSTWGVNDSEYVVFAFAAQAPVLTWRTLSVTVAPDGQTQVAGRADAQVIWDPARSAVSIINPTELHSMTVTIFPGPTRREAPVGSRVTVTDPTRIRSVVAVLNSLPIDNSGVHGCPSSTGSSFAVDLIGRGKMAVANISGDQVECLGLAIVVGSAPPVSVDDPGGALLKQVASILGTQLPKG